ncbi:hypothetical protein MXB_5335 [Myxobolus squamalis]|nr:hypothetical protein MXB_5335 [Myxobolus squamalis]
MQVSCVFRPLGGLPLEYSGKILNQMDANTFNSYPYSQWNCNQNGIANGPDMNNYTIPHNQNYAQVSAVMNGNSLIDVEHWKNVNMINANKSEYIQNNNNYHQSNNWAIPVADPTHINFMNINGIKDEQHYNAIFRDTSNGFPSLIPSFNRIPQASIQNNLNLRVPNQNPIRDVLNDNDFDRSKKN